MLTSPKEYLLDGIKKIGLEIDSYKIDKLIKYFYQMIEYNSHTNLTAIREDMEIIEKHFLDSLLLQKYIDPNAKNAIDIGTGAGFPGMVLSIVNPSINFLLLDSINKKTRFLEEVKRDLALSNVDIVTARAEDYIIKNREKFSLGFCRGVSKLNIILEYMLPFLKINGIFLPQKIDDSEVSLSANALNILKGRVKNIYNLELPFSHNKRIIIEIEKTGLTPIKYPRNAGIAIKKSL
ncbi:MAG: 16S rRNA (guanine(527)-N(7))-methyltransferase RsmG [Fusobacteriaceae bacterium]|jgi:16S rRNA (guanine527-N7)-methyltransferase|nr:16S rRNA (guanine(527)-N(7))-methyltransferase RsmG [Fusobacteriaceae bacterium]